jgi:hypothetical protein
LLTIRERHGDLPTKLRVDFKARPVDENFPLKLPPQVQIGPKDLDITGFGFETLEGTIGTPRIFFFSKSFVLFLIRFACFCYLKRFMCFTLKNKHFLMSKAAK